MFLTELFLALFGFKQESAFGDDEFAFPQTCLDLNPTTAASSQHDFSLFKAVVRFANINLRFTFIFVVSSDRDDKCFAFSDLNLGSDKHFWLQQPLWVGDLAANEQRSCLFVQNITDITN